MLKSALSDHYYTEHSKKHTHHNSCLKQASKRGVQAEPKLSILIRDFFYSPIKN